MLPWLLFPQSAVALQITLPWTVTPHLRRTLPGSSIDSLLFIVGILSALAFATGHVKSFDYVFVLATCTRRDLVGGIGV